MNRIEPSLLYNQMPCSIVAISCACGNLQHVLKESEALDYRADGYLTLQQMNKLVRSCLSVKRRIDFKRGERPKLKDLHIDEKAIVCVLGHYLYLNNDIYYSFFDNDEDDVVAAWLLN